MFEDDPQKRALESGDATRCPYCGHFEWIDVGMSGHVCEGMIKAQQEKEEQFNKRYKGDGSKVITSIALTIRSYDTEAALRDAIQDFLMDMNETSGKDDVLDFEWLANVRKQKL